MVVILAGLVGLDHPLRSQHLRELLPAAPNQGTVLRGPHRIYRVLPQHHSPAFSMGDILGIKQQCSIDNVVFSRLFGKMEPQYTNISLHGR